MERGVGDLISVFVGAAFFCWMFWAYARRRRSIDIVPDEPEGTPYRVYTRRYDIDARARDVPAKLRANAFLRTKGWVDTDPSVWNARVAAARTVTPDCDGVLAARLHKSLALTRPSEWAICFLVDQSGSMKGEPMRWAAASLRWCSDLLTGAGAQVAVLGFSTVGWHGGEPRSDWLAGGAPARPGRLAALLHVRYQMFGERLANEDWEVMLHPSLLRENIDGEAIDWAAGLLRERSEPCRVLVVLSDGAPVDDATLTHNGYPTCGGISNR